MSSKANNDRNSEAKVEVGRLHFTKGRKRNLLLALDWNPTQQRQVQRLLEARF